MNRLSRTVLISCTLLLAIPLSAHAQDMQSLLNEIQRLQRDMADLQKQVYGGGSGSSTPITSAPISNVGSGATPAVTQAGTVSSSGDVSMNARTEVRLQQLETQMRQLTGKIEETGFNIEQMSGRLDKLISDVDFRLQQLEQGRPAAGTATAPVPGQATPAQPAPNQSNSGTPVATMMPPATASGTTDDGSVQTLGTIPQSMANQATTPAPGSPPVAGNNGVPVSAGVAAAAPVPAQPATSATPSSGSMLPAGTPADQYKYAFDLLVRHEYAAAEAAFREFVEKNGEDVLAGNAQYWLGETYYVRENFADAAIAFAEGYQTWPNSSKAPDNLLKLAMSLARVGKNDDACAAFSQLGQQFPTAPANVKRRANSEKSRLKCPT